MLFLTFKVLHLIGAISWFAGLFYLPRLFVYHTEAFSKPEAERQILLTQFSQMEHKLYRFIMNPAMVITLIFGTCMIAIQPSYIFSPWLICKLIFVSGLIYYHWYCGKLIHSLASNQCTMTPLQMRMFNEIPTLCLVAILALAVFKSIVNFGILMVVLVVTGIALQKTIKWVNRK